MASAGVAVDAADVKAPKGSTSTSGSIFSQRMTPFPEPVEGKIATLPFLEGAKSVVSLVDLLGKTFAPVRYDMNGNIDKLTAKFNENSGKFEYLHDMIISEQAQGGLCATDALLWLRRALHFLHSFLNHIVDDFKSNKKSEDLSPFAQDSYRETLQKYHGFLARRLFNLLSNMMPSRSQLLKTFTLDVESPEEIIFQEMEGFLLTLESNLTVLSKFYEDFKLNPPEPKSL